MKVHRAAGGSSSGVTQDPTDPSALSGTLLEKSSLLIYVCNLNFEVVLFNRALRQTTGFDTKDCPNLEALLDHFYPDPSYRKIVSEIHERWRRNEHIRNTELSIACKSGEQRTISWSTSRLKTSGGTIGYVAMGVDVSQQKNWENWVTLFQRSIQFLNEGLVLTDPGGNILSWNNGARDLLGHDESAMQGRPLSDLFLKSERLMVSRTIDRTVESNGRYLGEVELERNDGEPVMLEFGQHRIDREDGMALARVTVLAEPNDAAEVKERHERLQSLVSRLQSQLRENKELQDNREQVIVELKGHLEARGEGEAAEQLAMAMRRAEAAEAALDEAERRAESAEKRAKDSDTRAKKLLARLKSADGSAEENPAVVALERRITELEEALQAAEELAEEAEANAAASKQSLELTEKFKEKERALQDQHERDILAAEERAETERERLKAELEGERENLENAVAIARAEAEAAAREELAVLRKRPTLQTHLASLSTFAVVSADVDGKILAWSEGAARLDARKPQDALGHIIHKDVLNFEGLDWKNLFARAVVNGKVEEEVTLSPARGPRIPVQLIARIARNAAGQPVGLTEVLRSPLSGVALEVQALASFARLTAPLHAQLQGEVADGLKVQRVIAHQVKDLLQMAELFHSGQPLVRLEQAARDVDLPTLVPQTEEAIDTVDSQWKLMRATIQDLHRLNDDLLGDAPSEFRWNDVVERCIQVVEHAAEEVMVDRDFADCGAVTLPGRYLVPALLTILSGSPTSSNGDILARTGGDSDYVSLAIEGLAPSADALRLARSLAVQLGGKLQRSAARGRKTITLRLPRASAVSADVVGEDEVLLVGGAEGTSGPSALEASVEALLGDGEDEDLELVIAGGSQSGESTVPLLNHQSIADAVDLIGEPREAEVIVDDLASVFDEDTTSASASVMADADAMAAFAASGGNEDDNLDDEQTQQGELDSKLLASIEKEAPKSRRKKSPRSKRRKR